MSNLFRSYNFTGKIMNRLSTVSAGLSLTLIFFVILTSQVGLYFWKTPIHTRDRLWIKGIVILIWMVQASQVALACHMTALAHSSNSALAIGLVTECMCEWGVYVGANAITACLVHAYFTSRIYLLKINSLRVRISMMLCVIVILEGSFGFICMVSFIMSALKRSGHYALPWSMPLWLGFSILVDISIAGSMYYMLKKGSPYFSLRLSLLINRVIKFFIQTGLITSLAAGVTVALWIVAQLDPGHLFMSFPIGGIYATCFMANLIARESYFHPTSIHVDEDSECFGMTTSSIAFATNEGVEKDESIPLAVD